MLRRVFDRISDANPKFNERLVNGLTKEELDKAPQVIDLLWSECVSTSFPDKLHYEDYSICYPEEIMRILTSPNNKDGKLEMTRTDFVLVKYNLSFENEDGIRDPLPPVYIPLPFCDDLSLTTIRNVKHHISNVVCDKVFSRVDKGLFVAFTRDRLTFERVASSFKLNGSSVNTFVTYSNIHAFSKQQKAKAGANPALVTYLFAKYGMRETFKKFTNVKDDDFVVGTHEELSSDDYPTDEWYIASAYKHRLAGFSDKSKVGTFDIEIAIRKEAYDKNKLMEDFIAGFFYSIEYFPSKVKLDWVDKKSMWISLLAEIIYQDTLTDSRKMSAVSNHIDSLDHYVDHMMIAKLQSIGCYAEDIYELFIYILQNIDELYITIDPASMDEKRIATREYVLLDVFKKINNFTYSVFKPSHRALDERAIRQKLATNIPRSTTLEVERHGEVSVVSFVGDNKMLKYATAMVSQVEATATGKPKKTLTDPASRFHPTIIGICSHLNQTKPNPPGKGKLNPCVEIDEYNSLSYRKELKPIFEKIIKQI